jgi:hypothetical protein
MCLSAAQREKYFLPATIQTACKDGGRAPGETDWIADLFAPLRPVTQALAPRLGDVCH